MLYLSDRELRLSRWWYLRRTNVRGIASRRSSRRSAAEGKNTASELDLDVAGDGPLGYGRGASSRRTLLVVERDYRFPLSPYALTDDVWARIVQAIALGAYDYIAAEAGGIDRRTFWRWMRAADRVEAELEELRDLGFKELRDRCRDLGLETKGKKDDLLGRIVGNSLRLLRFRDEVRGARAAARFRAEAMVAQKNPEAWLKYGPGRERDGEPGWTATPKGDAPTEPEIGPDETAGTDEIDYGKAAEIFRNLEEIGYFENVIALRRERGNNDDDEQAGDGSADREGGA